MHPELECRSAGAALGSRELVVVVVAVVGAVGVVGVVGVVGAVVVDEVAEGKPTMIKCSAKME